MPAPAPVAKQLFQQSISCWYKAEALVKQTPPDWKGTQGLNQCWLWNSTGWTKPFICCSAVHTVHAAATSTSQILTMPAMPKETPSWTGSRLAAAKTAHAAADVSHAWTQTDPRPSQLAACHTVQLHCCCHCMQLLATVTACHHCLPPLFYTCTALHSQRSNTGQTHRVAPLHHCHQTATTMN